MTKTIVEITVLLMALGSATHAAIYEQGTVKDASSESGDPDSSMGDATDNRLYPEFNGGDPEAKGIRPGFFQWDLSSIPTGSTIVSATMHFYLDRVGNAPAATGYYVRRLLPGKDWVESTTYNNPAQTGELTFNSQKHGVAAWQTSGARGALDVDIPGSVSFDASGGSDLQIALDVSSMVTEWVTNGVENNGVVVGGGTIPGAVVGSNHWDIGFRENSDVAKRPYLTIEWLSAGVCSTVAPLDTQSATGYAGGGAVSDVLHSMGTASGGGNQYWYADFFHSSYTIVAGDHLVYDIYTKNTTGPSGAVDLEGGLGNLRDSGILDQHGRNPHPGTDLTAVALNTWYSRDFDLSSKAGTTITAFEMGHETDTGVSEFYVRNVRIMNGTTVKLDAFPSGWTPPGGGEQGPGNNGYTSTVGPQTDTDPDPPGVQTINYTITNVGGTPFDWTVTEVLSDGTTPNDYAWLSVSPASGTGLAASASAPIVATLDSTTLTAGLYSAYLRFSNNCTPPVVEIRQIDFTVIGCAIVVQEPRLRFPGPCVSSATTTEVFTILNNGAFDWTGYQATELGDDDDWLTLSYTSGPVVQNATGTVTATIDWSQVPITGGDDQAATIRFAATCDGGATFVEDIPLGTGAVETINVVDTTPVKIMYNGDVSPSANNSGGTGYKFQLWEGSDQGTVVADPGVGQATDGFAYRIQDTNLSGANKTKWQSVHNDDSPAMDIDPVRGATVLARVKVLSATGSVFQSNLMIQNSTIAASYHWGGPNNLVKETQSDIAATVTGDANYHIIRITSRDTQGALGIVVNLYLDEDPTPVLTIPNAAPSSHGLIEAIGFGCGSSTAASQDIYFDWVWGTNAGAFAPGEEAACIGTLICSECRTPRVDADEDSDVDMDDFAVFQRCFTGSLVSAPLLSYECEWFDSDYDSDIDTVDFVHFVDCETGASVPWVASVNCPN